MNLDGERIDEAVLGLLYLTLHDPFHLTDRVAGSSNLLTNAVNNARNAAGFTGLCSNG